jgi:hypothetical protein
MEFHLPYFALRNYPQPKESNKARSKGLRKCKDLLFLKGENPQSEAQEKWYLHQAHISCVVFGFDHWNWAAHGFFDTGQRHENSKDEVTSSEEFNADPIARGLDANMPIGEGKPREYFLKAFEIQLKPYHEEWRALVRELTKIISEYVCFIALIFDPFLSISEPNLLY